MRNFYIQYLVTFGLLGTFIYFYKTSGKFRKSIIAAFISATVYYSGLKPAHSAGEADAAFTQQNQPHQSRPSHRSAPGKPDNSGSGSGGDGLPKFPQIESVEKTQEHLSTIYIPQQIGRIFLILP